jgi:uncharacterized protein
VSTSRKFQLEAPQLSTTTRTAPPLEAVTVVVVCFGWFILASLEAVAAGFPSSGAFSDASLIGLVALEALLGAVGLTFLRLRGYVLADLTPSPSWSGCLAGFALFAVATLASSVVTLGFSGGDAGAQPIAAMVSNAHVSLPVVIVMSMVNGLYEETFLVGYLVRGLRSHGLAIAVGVSLLVRILYHLYQGPLGAVSVLVFGLVISVFYWRTGRLWPVVFAHTLADALALT